MISLGAQGIPVGGFEPTPLNTGAGAGHRQLARCRHADDDLRPGDPGDADRPAALRTSTPTSPPRCSGATASPRSTTRSPPARSSPARGSRSSSTRTPSSSPSGVQKRTATGALLGVTHNINYLYSNSPTNVTPSAYTTNLQLSLTQPLLGSAPLAGGQAGPPVGLEANRAPIVIARLTADASVWRFKAEVMAEVRSIEQQYWSLAQQHVQLWSSEKAVELAEEILKREQSELEVGRGTVADVAEAQQRLEQFRLDLVTKTSDVITTERQLRNLLGLPPADDRRIVPVTAPTEARLEPDWDASLAQMLTFQPDIVQQQLNVRIAELQLLVSRNQLLPQLNLNALYQFNGLGHTLDTSEAVMTGKTITAIDPLISTQQRAAGLNSNPGQYRDFQQWQVGLTFQMPLGHAGAAGERPAVAVRPAPRAGLPPADRPPDDPLARPVLPRSRRQLQAVQDRLAVPGRGGPAARSPAGLLRGRPDHDRPLPRRRQPVRQRRRPGGAVQDQLQHLDRRPGRGQGDAAGLRQHRGGRGPEPGEGVHPGQATSRPRTGNCRSRPTATTTRCPVNGPAQVDPVPDRMPPSNASPGDTVPLPGPGRPARPAADPCPADGPGRRAQHPLVGPARPAAEPGVVRDLGRPAPPTAPTAAARPPPASTCRRLPRRSTSPRSPRTDRGPPRPRRPTRRGRGLDRQAPAPPRFARRVRREPSSGIVKRLLTMPRAPVRMTTDLARVTTPAPPDATTAASRSRSVGSINLQGKVATMEGSHGTCGGNRRRFLKTTAATGAALASADRLLAMADAPAELAIPLVTLGKTGQKVTRLGMGTSTRDRPELRPGRPLRRRPLHRHLRVVREHASPRRHRRGPRTDQDAQGRLPRHQECSQYGNARGAGALKVFEDHLDASLERLRTDHVDGYYIHGIDSGNGDPIPPACSATRASRPRSRR